MVRFLVLGSGGREHAIIKKLIEDKDKKDEIYCIGNNRSPKFLHILFKYVHLCDLTDADYISNYCIKNGINIVIIGPEAPLNTSLVGYLELYNIVCIGPCQSFAKIETDKGYLRTLFDNHSNYKYIPKYRIFSYTDNKDGLDISSFYDFIKEVNYSYVVKHSGLCSGKGVKLSDIDLKTIDDALVYANEILKKKQDVVIEEKLLGEEFSYHSFTDGKTVRHTFPIQDYKRLLENNEGPNTGSMGCISKYNESLPFLTENDIKIVRTINEILVNILNKKHDTEYGYKGILYGSFIKTVEGDIKIIEYNARFGDPEVIPILERMNTNFRSLLVSMAYNMLHLIDNISFKHVDTITKYIVPDGYPKRSVKGAEIYMEKDIQKNYKFEYNIYYASVYTDCVNNINASLLGGSRAIAISVYNKNEAFSEVNCNEMNGYINSICDNIKGPVFYRKDIGKLLNVKTKPIVVISKDSISYKESGVNIEVANQIVSSIEKYVTNTQDSNITRHEVISTPGDFSGMLSMSKDNVLVASIDGVGTKTSFLPKLLVPKEAFNTMGKDIVNHGINDTLVKGAHPILFLDYIASSKLDKKNVEYILEGMSEACISHGCPILGGETAEMPGVYKENSYDVVGTMIGEVNPTYIIDGIKNVTDNCIIFGLPSNGPHTNGYSLIRKLFDKYDYKPPVGYSFINWITQPHKSYYNEIMSIRKIGIDIKALCHVTGGGFIDNPVRVIPENVGVEFNKKAIMDENFMKLQELLNISDDEMYQTFNCGIGMLIFVENDKIILDSINNNLSELNLKKVGKTFNYDSKIEGAERTIFINDE